MSDLLPQLLRHLPLTAASDYPLVTLLFATLGALCTLVFCLRVSTILLQTFLVPGKSLKHFGAKKGAWAVVTGATDGIGREFALQLAKAGFNVFLASRNAEKLSIVATEIETQYGVWTKTQAIDFSKSDNSAWIPLRDSLSDLEVGVLVNNVGKSHEMPTDFVETPQNDIDDIVQINVKSTLKVTNIILPGLISRKRGLILNISSFAGVFPSPMLATYAGSKAFISTWSQSLAKEVESKGVIVRVLNTAFVVSNMSKVRRPNVMTPTAKGYVRAALSKIDVQGGALGKPYTGTPYWSHSILNAFITELNWPSLIINYIFNLHKDIRRRALRKKEREAAAAKKN